MKTLLKHFLTIILLFIAFSPAIFAYFYPTLTLNIIMLIIFFVALSFVGYLILILYQTMRDVSGIIVDEWLIKKEDK